MDAKGATKHARHMNAPSFSTREIVEVYEEFKKRK